MKEKPEVGKAILFSFAALIAYYVCYFALAFIGALIFSVLAVIPIVNRLVDALFSIRGDSPSIAIVFFSVILSYQAAKWVIGRFCDYAATEKLALRITGALLLLYNILLVIRNISADISFFPNVLAIIAGIVMILGSNNVEQK